MYMYAQVLQKLLLKHIYISFLTL